MMLVLMLIHTLPLLIEADAETSFVCLISELFYRKQFRQDCQLILVPKSTQDSKDYGEIKLASDTVLGIPSQV